MFVTSDRAVFNRYTSKNATLLQTAKDESEKEIVRKNNTMTQVLTNLLVQGIHRFRQGYSRGPNGQQKSAKEEWEDITGFPDAEDDTEALFKELQALPELETTETQRPDLLLKEAVNLLKSSEDNPLTFAQLRDAFRLIKQASTTSGVDRKKVKDVMRLHSEQRDVTRTVFEQAQGVIKNMREGKKQSLSDPSWNEIDIDKLIAEQVKKMDDLHPRSGQNFLYKLDLKQFTDSSEFDIKRCTTCKDVKRFPMILVTYDGEEVNFQYPLKCSCVTDDSVVINKLIFMPDLTANYMQISKESDQKERFAPMFLFNIDKLFIQKKKRGSFKLQFMYLFREQYTAQKVYVKEAGADVLESSTEQSNPLDALMAYVDEAMSEEVDIGGFASAIDPIVSEAQPATASGLVNAFFGYFRGGSSKPVPQSKVQRSARSLLEDTAEVQRAADRKTNLYGPLRGGIDRYLKAKFKQVPIVCILDFTTISGNTRQRLAIDATIDLHKRPKAQKYIIISPQEQRDLENIMSREIRLLGSSKSPQWIDSAMNIAAPAKPAISRLIISADADGLEPRSNVTKEAISFKFGVLLQCLERDGLAILLNHSMEQSEYDRFNTFYHFNNKDNIMLTAMNYKVGDVPCLLFFFDGRRHPNLPELPVLRTELCGTRDDIVVSAVGGRKIQMGQQTPIAPTATTESSSFNILPVSDKDVEALVNELDGEYIPALSDAPLSPPHNTDFAGFDALIQTVEALRPVTLESLLQSVSLSLPSPLIGSRLWRSGTQLALMLRS